MRRLPFLARILPLAVLAACAGDPQQGSEISYACASGGGFSVTYNRDASLAQLAVPGRRYSLALRPSDGARIYSDGIVVLRIQDGSAGVIGAAGGPYRDCRPAPNR